VGLVTDDEPRPWRGAAVEDRCNAVGHRGISARWGLVVRSCSVWSRTNAAAVIAPIRHDVDGVAGREP
jgi:hypothetical protein